MTLNRLKLNADKTQLIWLGTRQQLAKLTVTQLQLSTSVVEFDSVVTDLVIVLDCLQVSAVLCLCFYQISQLCVVQRSPTKGALRSLTQALIRCRSDYCNALLAGITDIWIKRLQSLQNTAAHLVSGAWQWDHITPVHL